MARPQKRVKREHIVEEPASRCQFLEIPIELRHLIYEYVIAETNHVTISVAEVEKNIFDNSTPKETVEGIPGQFVPLLKSGFDPKTMEIGKVEKIPLPDILETRTLAGSMDSGYGSFDTSPWTGGGQFDRPNHPKVPSLTAMSLLFTNRQIHQEMTAHINHPTCGRSTLHVNYPYGIIVLETLYPCLLRYADRICISGWYGGEGDESTLPRPSSGAAGRDSSNVPLVPAPESVYELANSALARLIRTTMPRVTHPTLTQLSFRIYYPWAAEHSVIWACNQSPIPVALKNTCGGKIDMRILRGVLGNGVILNMKAQPDARHLTTVWRRFQGPRSKERDAWRGFGDAKTWDREFPLFGGAWV